MTKKELIAIIAHKNRLPIAQVETVINAAMYEIKCALIEGDQVQLIGFGTFAVKERAARKGTNPRTGEEIEIPAHNLPCFTPGKSLKDAIKQ